MDIFVAGTMVPKNGNPAELVFALVHCKGIEMPYLVTSKNGLLVTASMADLFRVSEDLTEVSIVEDPRRYGPASEAGIKKIKLTEEQTNQIRSAIEKNYYFD